MHTNTHGLIRELSGPRPLRRVLDIVFKPRIYSATGRRFAPNLRNYGPGRATISSTSPPPHAAVTLMLDCSVSLVYATRKFLDIVE